MFCGFSGATFGTEEVAQCGAVDAEEEEVRGLRNGPLPEAPGFSTTVLTLPASTSHPGRRWGQTYRRRHGKTSARGTSRPSHIATVQTFDIPTC